jgi:hypothetical protein
LRHNSEGHAAAKAATQGKRDAKKKGLRCMEKNYGIFDEEEKNF